MNKTTFNKASLLMIFAMMIFFGTSSLAYADKISTLNHKGYLEAEKNIDLLKFNPIFKSFCNDKYVEVGNKGIIQVSSDNKNWERIDTGLNLEFTNINYFLDSYYIVGNNKDLYDGMPTYFVYRSKDLTNWELVVETSTYPITAVNYFKGKYVAVTTKRDGYDVIVSEDLKNWSEMDIPDHDQYTPIKNIVTDGNQLVLQSSSAANKYRPVERYPFEQCYNVHITTDFKNWNIKSLLNVSGVKNYQDFYFNGEEYIVEYIDRDNEDKNLPVYKYTYKSKDLTSWSFVNCKQLHGDLWRTLTFDIYSENNKHFLSGYIWEDFMKSAQHYFWETSDFKEFKPIKTKIAVSHVVKHGDIYVGTLIDCLYKSNDGFNWEPVVKLDYYLREFFDIIYFKDKFIAVGHNPFEETYTYIYYSQDGVKWNKADLDENVKGLKQLVTDGDKILAIGEENTLLSSYDGINWTDIKSNFKLYPSPWYGNKMIYDGNKFLMTNDCYVSKMTRIYSSKDGVNWEWITFNEIERVYKILNYKDNIIIYGDSVVGDGKENIFVTKDGLNLDVYDIDYMTSSDSFDYDNDIVTIKEGKLIFVSNDFEFKIIDLEQIKDNNEPKIEKVDEIKE